MVIIAEMHDAASSLPELIEKARLGDDIVIARNGKPVARLVPLKQRPMGYYAGKIVIHDDFDAPLPR